MNINVGEDEIIIQISVRDFGVKRRATFDAPVYSCIFSEGAGLCSLDDIVTYSFTDTGTVCLYNIHEA